MFDQVWITHKLPLLGCSSFNAHALGALAEVAGPGLSSHIGTILPTLILAMDDEDEVRSILNTY